VFIARQQAHAAAEERRRAMREGTYMEGVDSPEQHAGAAAGSEGGAGGAPAGGSHHNSSSGAAVAAAAAGGQR
jgi:hypothetical protein